MSFLFSSAAPDLELLLFLNCNLVYLGFFSYLWPGDGYSFYLVFVPCFKGILIERRFSIFAIRYLGPDERDAKFVWIDCSYANSSITVEPVLPVPIPMAFGGLWEP